VAQKDQGAGRTVLRGARASALGFVVRFGARILFLYLAGRLFGAALFGAYALATAAVELAVAIGGVGSKRLLFKRLDEDGDRLPAHVLLDVAILVTAVSVILAAGFVLAGLLLPARLLAPQVALGFVVLAPMIAGQALLDLMLAATRWTHAIRWEVTSRSIIEPYAAVAVALAAWRLGGRETGLLLSYWAGTLCALAYAVAGAWRCLGGLHVRAYRLPRGRLPMLLRDSAGATANDTLNALFGRIDMYLVGLFLGAAPAGIYGMARQIRTPVRQVRQSFDSLLNPVIARTLAVRGPAATGGATATASRLILAVQLPLLIVLVLAGKPLLEWIGPGFAAGYWALVLLGTAEAIQGAFGVSDLIILYRRPLASLRITGANIVFNLLAGWLLIRWLGVTGAAFSVLAGVMAGAIVRRLTLRMSFGVRVPLHHSLGPLAAAAVALAGGVALRSAPMWASAALAAAAAAVVSLAVYGAGIKLWQKLSGHDLSLTGFETAAGDQAAATTLS
jgi:O-antigen/teichoic acid export membrane protein